MISKEFGLRLLLSISAITFGVLSGNFVLLVASLLMALVLVSMRVDENVL